MRPQTERPKTLFHSHQIEKGREAPPQLVPLLLRLRRDVRRARRTREVAKQLVQRHAVAEDLERVLHRDGGVLLEVLPAVHPRS